MGTSQHRMARHDQSRLACVGWRPTDLPTAIASPRHPIRVARLAQPRRPSAASRTIREEGPVSYTFVYWAVLQGIICSRDQYREERPLIPNNPKRKLLKKFHFPYVVQRRSDTRDTKYS